MLSSSLTCVTASEWDRRSSCTTVSQILAIIFISEPEIRRRAANSALMRFALYHGFEASYFEFLRRSSTVLGRDIVIDDEIFPASTEVDTSQDSQTVQFIYGYSLCRNAQKELGIFAGLHRIQFLLYLPREPGAVSSWRLNATRYGPQLYIGLQF